ncbi:MAG: peptidylprolyl isomerase [Alphaproteobacteria bacterium]|nr:peptidylprolyl isomerase [Alphaproteobacteria bacterium]MCB9985387.1 peptidylprolyl isomerase [Micavibrio sp.]
MKFMKFIRIFVAVAMLSVVISSSSFAGQESIVAVVNQGVVTASDLNARLNLIASSTGLQPSKELNDKLRPQVLDMLVEEQIKMQEAQRLNISVESTEIDSGFEMIAKQNNIPVDVFKKALTQHGVRLSTLRSQIEAQLAWTKVVQKRVRPRVEVSDADIESEIEQLRANIGKNQYRLAEIFLPVADGTKASDVKALARKLSDQLAQTPEAFQKVARQFSQSAGAEQGGMIGWVFGGQVSKEVETVLPSLTVGKVSSPVETPAGFYILLAVDKRQISEDTLPSHDDVMQRIGTQRLDRAQRRYMMDLFSASFIEKRI